MVVRCEGSGCSEDIGDVVRTFNWITRERASERANDHAVNGASINGK